ncbi:glycosyltransferase [Coleofasciculus sp. G2-EDA-02]|uniref:glycosyltransferase n=1 Tax=Coleofasciculus sp. G2-EDA-02 TaxID=3069529 RepID=UPI0032F58AC7
MIKNKIGIVFYSNPDYYPPTINAVHLLAEYFDIVLICRNQNLSHWQYPSNVRVYRLGQYTSVEEKESASPWAKFLEYTNFVVHASHILKDVSLIYAYDAFGYAAAYLSRVVVSPSIPMIYHNHDINEHLFPLISLSGWVQKIERNIANKAAIVVFPSQERALFFKQVSNFKNHPNIVPNFPRKSFFKQLPNKMFENLISERFKKKEVLLQGSISEKNSMLDLIKSLNYLNKNITLKLIGVLREKELLLMRKLAIKQDVADRVDYFRPVPYAEIQSHTLNASVGVCLYKKISLNNQTMATASNKVYEYAACGLPVIISDFENHRKYLENESWVRFADPDNSHSIASAVQDILSDFENYRKMCLAARKAFEEKFNYETVFSPLLFKIKELVDESKKSQLSK